MPYVYPPPKTALAEPLRVSPFIRACRWTFLIGGIAWGAHRLKVNTRKEEAYQEYVRTNAPAWDAELARKKAIADRSELLYLAEATGTKIPADFDEKYPPAK